MDTGYINYVFVDQAGQVMEIHSTDEKTYDAIDPKQYNPGYSKMKIMGPLGTLIAERKKGHYVQEITGTNLPATAIGVAFDTEQKKNFSILRKTKVTLTANKTQIRAGDANTGEVSIIKHDSKEPVNIWINDRPVLGSKQGRVDMNDGHSVRSATPGSYIVQVRDIRYYSDPLVIDAILPPGSQNASGNSGTQQP